MVGVASGSTFFGACNTKRLFLHPKGDTKKFWTMHGWNGEGDVIK